MAKVKNISGEARQVPELGWRNVGPGDVVEVPNERVDGYTCQTTIWELVKGGK